MNGQTIAERVARHRAKIAREGGRQIAVMLTPEATAKLELWRQRGESVSGILNRLLTRSRP